MRNKKALKTLGGVALITLRRSRCPFKSSPDFGRMQYVPWVAGQQQAPIYYSEIGARIAGMHFLRTGKWLLESSPVIRAADK